MPLTVLVAAVCLSTFGAPPASPGSDALPADHADTQSVGHPFYGLLRGGVRMPLAGPHHDVQPTTRLKDWTYGTGYLVRGIVRVAEVVARAVPHGERLAVCNLSKSHGGDINMSVSHNSGRDVDFAYFNATLDGASAPSVYHRYGADGRSVKSPGKYRLDLARNWALVQALMAETEFEVQWIIVSPHIERLLLEYAASMGVPRETLLVAERLMVLPGYAKAHDDHVHVRVLCSPEDWRRECKNAGPVWPFSRKLIGALEALRRDLSPRLLSADPGERRAALAALAHRHVDTAIGDVAPLLSDSDASVREAALVTLLGLTTEANAPSVLKIARWVDGRAAASLLAKALPLAGPEGLATAHEVLAGRHPALQPTDAPAVATKAGKKGHAEPNVTAKAHELIRSCRHLPSFIQGELHGDAR